MHVAVLASTEMVSLISVGAGFSCVSWPETIIKNPGVTLEELRLKKLLPSISHVHILAFFNHVGLTFLNSTELSNN